MPKKYRGFKIQEIARDSMTYAYLRQVVELQEISTFLSENRDSLLRSVEQTGNSVLGFPTGLFWAYDTLAMNTDMAVAAAVTLKAKSKPDTLLQRIRVGGQALLLDYQGPYENIEEAHLAMTDYLTEKKLTHVPPIVEEYLTDPEQEPDTTKWLTRIIYFLEMKADSTVVGKK